MDVVHTENGQGWDSGLERRTCLKSDTFLHSSKKCLLSSYLDLLVSATLSVRPIRLEPDLLVSTTLQLLLPVCSRISNLFDINI